MKILTLLKRWYHYVLSLYTIAHLYYKTNIKFNGNLKVGL